jgi:hypothetical protein
MKGQGRGKMRRKNSKKQTLRSSRLLLRYSKRSRQRIGVWCKRKKEKADKAAEYQH